MSGCRALKDTEYQTVKENLVKARDKLLFILGFRTGFRITELLSLKIKDVLNQNRIKVRRGNMKGKSVSREVVLHTEALQAINDYMGTLETIDPEQYLFKSLRGEGSLTRQGAHLILKEAYKKAKLEGCLATHTMRKSFASRVYNNTQFDLIKTQRALGHTSILNTVKYLSTDQDEIDLAILK